eukprot:PITA_15629
MNKPLPTWRNRRVREATLVIRLDRFLIKVPLLHQLNIYRQWVGFGCIFDHSPIYLEILGPHSKPRSPFKFNHVWLHDPGYTNLVTDYWMANPIMRHKSLADGFCHNLSQLKHLSITWAKEKDQRDDHTLSQIESKLSELMDDRNKGFTTTNDKSHLIELEKQKEKILNEREETWRLKSRAIWLQAGDDNTKFFQNYAKGRKVSNTIWNLPLPDGDELKSPVKTAELEGTLNWFKKDKSPGPDRWTIEFYLAFYELLGQDLLNVVEECRTTGKLYDSINSAFIALIPKSECPSSFNDFQPIFLCNCLYKIIANRIRPILSHHISFEQFSFLEHR